MGVQLALSFIEPEPPLSNEDISRLHIRLLEESLHQLVDSRVGEDVREEIRSWVRKKGVWPFSFDACCLIAGVDPERTRESLRRITGGENGRTERS